MTGRADERHDDVHGSSGSSASSNGRHSDSERRLRDQFCNRARQELPRRIKSALEESNWQQLDADQVATGKSLTVNDGLAANSQRFYRILVLD